MKTQQFALLGAFIGAVIGYPASYYFQPSGLRAKLAMGGYIEHISDILKDKSLQSTAIGTWIIAVVLLAVVGFAIGRIMDQKR